MKAATLRQAIPPAMLGVLAVAHYSDKFLTWLTGWPIEWAYAIGQAAGSVGLWCGVFALAVMVGLPARPIGTTCLVGATDSALRAGCLTWQMIWPVEIKPEQNVCEAVTGLDLYAIGLFGLSVAAIFTAAHIGLATKSRNDAGASR